MRTGRCAARCPRGQGPLSVIAGHGPWAKSRAGGGAVRRAHAGAPPPLPPPVAETPGGPHGALRPPQPVGASAERHDLLGHSVYWGRRLHIIDLHHPPLVLGVSTCAASRQGVNARAVALRSITAAHSWGRCCTTST